jgi:ribonucleoside-diphosphate reductase alpha chain
LIKHLKGIGGSGAIGFGANRVESIADAVAKALEIHTDSEPDGADAYVTAAQEITAAAESPAAGTKRLPVIESKDLCPSCGSASLINSEGCKNCSTCGYSRCS